MSGFLVNKGLLDPTVTQYAGGTATFTLPQSGSTNATEVTVGGVAGQVPGVDFNVTGGTTLTLTTSAPAGANMVCVRQYFSDGITGTAGANTVATAAIQNDAVNTAKILNDSVTGSKLNPALVAGDIIYADGTDTINRLAKGAALQTLQMNAGATAPNWVTASAGFTQATAQVTTSGTLLTFSSIPAGVKVIHITFMGFAGSGGGHGSVKLGDAGGIESTGYAGSSAIWFGSHASVAPHTDNWEIYRYQAADTLCGHMTMVLGDASNTWTQGHVIGTSSSSYNGMYWGGGSKSLSGELTQLTVGLTGSTFNAGSVNIVYM